jgi:hypothetical protein
MRSRPPLIAAAAAALALAAPAHGGTWIGAPRDVDPVWSPDGTKIAFTRIDSRRAVLEVLDVASGRVRALAQILVHEGVEVTVPSSTAGFDPSWSPDGTRVVVERYAESESYDVATGGRRALGFGFEPVWGPGDLIAQLAPADQYERNLVVVHPDGTALPGIDAIPIERVSWCDARTLVYARQDVAAVDVVAKRSRTLVAPGVRGSSPTRPSCSRDGRTVAYLDGGRVRTVPLDASSPPATLTPVLAQPRRLSWSHDGRLLAVRTSRGVEAVSRDGGARVLAAHAFGTLAEFAPARDEVAFSAPYARCPGHAALAVVDLAGAVRTLTGSCRVDGTAKADAIVGTRGRGDDIRAGAGNDVVRARDGARDLVDCGAGRDTVYADSFDRLRGCEVVR